MKLRHLVTALLLCLSSSVFAGTVMYGPASPSAEINYWGTNKIEKFYVAIHINDTKLVGKQITGLEVPVPQTDNLYDLAGFITTTLAVTGNNNNRSFTPNVAIKSGSVDRATNLLKVQFDEPYTIPSSGVYVGYTIGVSSMADYGDPAFYPVAVCNGMDYNTGLWVFSGGTYKDFIDLTGTTKSMSAMRVLIDGDFPENSATLVNAGKAYGARGETAMVPMSFINNGSNPITTLDYTYTMNSVEYEGHADLEMPVLNQLYVIQQTYVPVTTPDVRTDQILFRLKKINGEELNPEPSAVGTLRCLTKVPVTRPFVEEYTGTWCGNCPKGIVGMKYLKDNHGDDFVGVAYHASLPGQLDPMEMAIGHPGLTNNFPAMFINRGGEMDPYFGTSGNKQLGINGDWETAKKRFSPVEIDLYAEWADAEMTKINVTATANFREKVTDDFDQCRIYLVLVQDELKGPAYGAYASSWRQTNYFYNDYSYNLYEGLSQYVYEPAEISMSYDHVAILTNGYDMSQGAFSGNVTVDEDIVYNYTFDLADAVGIEPSNANLATRPNKMHVVAAVMLNENWNHRDVLNSNKCQIAAFNSVESLSTDGVSAVQTEWYDMQGCRVSAPHHGIYLRVQKMSDGTRRTSKVCIR